jgi:hypothetical protein
VKTKRVQALSVRAVRGSDAARRSAALLLEAWCGVRSTQSASEAMGVALPRFYHLEARALGVLVSAMEPRPRGRQKTAESELAKLKAETQRLRREVERYQSLYRTAQRSLGIAFARPPAPQKNAAPGSRRKRGPRKKARGQSVAAVLLGGAPPAGAREANNGATEQGLGARGQGAGRRGEQVAGGGHSQHNAGDADRG